MASFETLRDFYRQDANLRQSIVRDVLPEHFYEDYPNLISFLEGYYEYMDSNDEFGGYIQELISVRDIEDQTLKKLDFLFYELALGVSNEQFTNAREAIRNFGNFFRVKGTLFSGEGFFRGFYDESVEISYPKDSLFKVGESTVGVEDGKVMQDGGKYQIFSIFVKSPLALATWGQLWRKYVHPSGFFLSAEVLLEGIPDPLNLITDESMPDPWKNIYRLFSTYTLIYDSDTAQGEASHVNNYGNGLTMLGITQPQDYMYNPARTSAYRLISHFDSDAVFSPVWADIQDSNMKAPKDVNNRHYASINDLMTVYRNVKDWADWGLFLDQVRDSAGRPVITMDNQYETFDNVMHQTVEGPYVDSGYSQFGGTAGYTFNGINKRSQQYNQ